MKYLNSSHAEHSVIAVVIQIVMWLFTDDWWLGAAAGSFFFIGREIRDAEYRYRSLHKTTWGKMPFLAGVHPSVWKIPADIDGWLDWVLPVISTVAVATITVII